MEGLYTEAGFGHFRGKITKIIPKESELIIKIVDENNPNEVKLTVYPEYFKKEVNVSQRDIH